MAQSIHPRTTDVSQAVYGEYDRVPEFDPRTGQHLWTMNAAYRWGGPSVETHMLDLENLILLVGPGCCHCEQTYSPATALRRCKGRPAL